MSLPIRIEDLFLIYGKESEKVVALRGLHLEIAPGECLVIRGPNGSGKSTLVKLLTGYLTPTAGSIFLGERDIKDIDVIQLRREYIASVDQRGNLIEDLTILENLSLGYQLNNIGRTESHERSAETLASYGLKSSANKYPKQVSAAQRQIASILAALATEPKILIADEPSAELDDTLAELVYTLLRSLAGNTTVILVTHDDRAELFADRVVRIQEGRVSEEWIPGQPEKSVTDPSGWMRVIDKSPKQPSRTKTAINAVIAPFLIVQELSLANDHRKIFSDASFEVSKGQLFAIDSSNSAGSGKTSLLRVLAGIADASSGSIGIDGIDIGLLDRSARAEFRRRYIGYLDQRSSAFENISLSDFFGELTIPQDQNFLYRGNQSLGTFSGGERAYIELNKILVEAKPLLLLDEPTSQIDDKRTLASIQKIFDYVDNGGVVVITTREKIILESADLVINLQPPQN